MFKLETKNNKVIIRVFGIKIFSYYKNNFTKMFKNFFVSIICWFIPNKKLRKHIRQNFVSTIIKDINVKRRNTPVEPWAFIRVKNKISTIETSLNSILPAINKGVIAFNECDDGSEEYIINFCKIHKGFIPYKYPYKLFPLNDSRNGEKGHDENKIHTYYNKALEVIPKGEWIIKIDVDQIYDAEKLKKIFYLPKNNNDAIILTRFNMHYENEKLFFIKNAPFLITSDHWLIKNDNLEFELNKGKNSFVERLDITGFNVLYSESSNYHFPCIKNWRKVNQDNIIEFDEFMKNGGFDKYLKENRIENLVDRSMIDKNKIIQICKTFNFEKNRILPKE